MLLQVSRLHKSYPNAKEVVKGIVTGCDLATNEGNYSTEHIVLQDIDFQIKSGEICCFLGENGSGKSTLLRILAALESPNSGDVIYQGKNLKNYALALVKGHPEIKLVHQNFQLFPRSTIRENLLHALRYLPPNQKQVSYNELIDLLEISHVAEHLPAQTSGGEQQRAALAIALAQKPKLLLMDEPFSNLDRIQRDRLRTVIKKMHQRLRLSIVFVTHDYEDALSLSDTIYILQEGRIIESGNPQQLYFQPKHAYTASITGPTNILSKEQAEKAGFQVDNQTNTYFIRPEFLQIHHSGLEVKVKDSFFIGHGYLIKVLHKKNTLLVRHDTPLEIGKIIYLRKK